MSVARPFGALAGVLAFGLALTLFGCFPSGDAPQSEPKSQIEKAPHEREAPPLSQELLVSLSLARNLHHRADVFLKDGNLAQAIASIENVLRIRFPDGAIEAEETRLDARARLAKLYEAAGRPEDARRVVDEGLGSTTRDSFFLANLHAVSGELYTTQAIVADDTDPRSGKELRHKALAAFDTSIAINLRVQAEILKEAQP